MYYGVSGSSLVFAKLVLPLLIMGIGALGFFPVYRKKFTGTGWSWIALPFVIIASIGLALLRAQQLGLGGPRSRQFQHPYSGDSIAANEIWLVITCVCAGLLLTLAVPFIMRLYNKWMGKSLTEAEKLPAVAGVRAWLGGSNLIVAVLISVCAWLGYFYSFWGVLTMMLAVLLAYPLFNMLSQTARAITPPPLPEPADLSDEREKILQLLEQSKITADEGSELLAALGQSAPPPIIEQSTQPKTATNGSRKIMMIGALLVLVGFFLPWFSVNINREMTRMMGQMPQMPGMNGNMGMLPQNAQNAQMSPDAVVMGQKVRCEIPTQSFPGWKFNIPTQHILGQHVQRGFGWIVLLLAGGVAFAPNLLPKVTPEKLKMISLCALGLGGIILLFVLTRQLRNVGVGILLAMAGYVLMFIEVSKTQSPPSEPAA